MLLAGLFLAGCHQDEQVQKARPVVKTMRVGMEADSSDRTYSGVVVARYEVQESFRVDGRIDMRLVDVGDRVSTGQVLAALDESDLRLSMESAEAEYKAATSNRRQALTDEERYAALLARNVISRSEFDVRHLAAEEARGRLDRAERAFDLAKNRLRYAHLVCSTDGVVTKVSGEAGQVVAPGQSIVSVAKDGELEVRVDIPESQIQNLKDSPAEVTLWSSEDGRFHAVLREISPSADPATRTYAVRYTLRETNASVRLGMTAILRLSGRAGVPAALVPASAVVDQGRGEGTGVWGVDPGTGRLSFRHVTIERYTERGAYVRGEIADGDIIVVAGAHKLDKNMEVRPITSSQEERR
ncbi:efflux RND transporter periplasmic adaptor subunit [Desulfovibrio aminophilus]|uniref:efflux RND transporter periplasmic adaptor subunit n=1 Tax=Desulfovibrio aminophilus TaxID=81425 RepID=UPI00339AE493